MVRAVFSGDQLHHVITPMSCGAKTMPSNVIALMKTAVRVATLLARLQADSSPSVAIFFENVVINAVESAPSAKRSRNMFGTRNAIRNASRFRPAPKRPANICSRMSPSTRLQRIATPTTPVARVLIRSFPDADIGEKKTADSNFAKGKTLAGRCRSYLMSILRGIPTFQKQAHAAQIDNGLLIIEQVVAEEAKKRFRADPPTFGGSNAVKTDHQAFSRSTFRQNVHHRQFLRRNRYGTNSQ